MIIYCNLTDETNLSNSLCSSASCNPSLTIAIHRGPESSATLGNMGRLWDRISIPSARLIAKTEIKQGT